MRAGTASMMTVESISIALKHIAYEGFRRDRWQQPEAVLHALGVGSGQVIAELGSGTGYFTFRLAARVGPTGRVYAVDVDRQLLAHIARQASREGLRNIETVPADADDLHLPPGAIDVVFTSNAYHHLTGRVSYFAGLRQALRPEARVAILDNKGGSWFGKLFGHWSDSAVIRAEMQAAGYRLETEHTFLPQQSFLVFTHGGG